MKTYQTDLTTSKSASLSLSAKAKQLWLEANQWPLTVT